MSIRRSRGFSASCPGIHKSIAKPAAPPGLFLCQAPAFSLSHSCSFLQITFRDAWSIAVRCEGCCYGLASDASDAAGRALLGSLRRFAQGSMVGFPSAPSSSASRRILTRQHAMPRGSLADYSATRFGQVVYLHDRLTSVEGRSSADLPTHQAIFSRPAVTRLAVGG